nr:B-cell antigen receptor complex-associated protein beta chain [Danio rerio]|eukprot:XP_009304705.2 B-cell antigen receptor complex-associated protein beta chain [Danio rerio]
MSVLICMFLRSIFTASDLHLLAEAGLCSGELYSFCSLSVTDVYITFRGGFEDFNIMHHFLLGFSVMALIYLSAEGSIIVFQKPRFIGVKTGRTVIIYCVPSNPTRGPARVQWFKNKNYQSSLTNDQRITINDRNNDKNASITLKKVETEDSGTYVCKLNDTFGPGTELQVSRFSEPHAVLMRSRVKDVIIFLQAFLLVLCIVVPLVRLYKLEKKEEAEYEEPEDDHIYEGLEIEQVGGDVYEDISTFAQSSDAAWQVESPCQE